MLSKPKEEGYLCYAYGCNCSYFLLSNCSWPQTQESLNLDRTKTNGSAVEGASRIFQGAVWDE